MFDVKWTGEWPCLCHGEWIIKKNGVDVSDKIPESLRDNHMNTWGDYSEWRFENGWEVVWSSYTDGLSAVDWIKQNHDWVYEICDNTEEALELYYEIACHDWRHGSCGGCI